MWNFFIFGSLPEVGACSLVATEAFAGADELMHLVKLETLGICLIARLANIERVLVAMRCG